MRTNLVNIRPLLPSLCASLLLSLGAGMAYAADSSKGAELYSRHCAGCHGSSGNSVMPNAPNFALGESLMQPDSKLVAFVKVGKNSMPGYQGVLKENEIMDVIAFIRTLR